MKLVKLSIATILGYILIMIVGNSIKAFILSFVDNNFLGLILLCIIQLSSYIFIMYMIKMYFNWESVGFNKINYRNLIWVLPYVLILACMGSTFLKEIIANIDAYNIEVWITLTLTLLGTILAGYCEEVLFRGILLNSLIKEKSLVLAMIISSIGFSVLHITTILNGVSIIGAVYNVIYASLLGFSFVALAIVVNNIWPLVIYHVLWNYFLIASQTLNINLSKVSLLANPLNIIIGTVLWIIIIFKHNKTKSSNGNKIIECV